MDKRLSHLRTFLTISNAAFDFINSIHLAFNRPIPPNKMQELHKLALKEIEKESPDLSKIDYFLAEMESLAAANSQPIPKNMKVSQ
jgi:hypothetical protein